MRFRARLLVLALAALTIPVSAASARQGPPIPPPRGMVSDFANVIPPGQAARIARLAEYVRAQSGGEIAVVTLADLAGRDVAEVALRIGREWKVGAKAEIGAAARNAGIVILAVPKETSRDGRGYISIQTGQGTEGFITDAQTGDIRREAMPLLQARDYGGALELITQRVAQRYAATFGFSLDSFAPVPQRRVSRAPRRVGQGGPNILPLAFVVFIVLLFLLGGGRARGNGCLWLALAAQGGGRRYGGGGWGGDRKSVV